MRMQRPPPPEQSRAPVLHRAWISSHSTSTTAAAYGFGRNEELVGPVVETVSPANFPRQQVGITGESGKRVHRRQTGSGSTDLRRFAAAVCRPTSSIFITAPLR